MIISRLLLSDYGLYKGKNEILFPHPDFGKNITVIGGLNGRGKTTILEAITVALYGKRSINILRNGRISYQKFIKDHFNKKAQSKHASLELTFFTDQAFSQEIHIVRSWILTGNDVTENFTASLNHEENSNLSQNWDYFVEDMLPLSISRFFFFDNERISEIAEDESFESIKGSIKALFGVTTIDQLITDLKSNEKKRNQKIISDDSNSLGTRISETHEEIENLEKEIRNLYNSAAENRTQAKIARKEYARLETEFWEQGGNLGLKRDDYLAQQNTLSKTLSEKKEQVLDYVLAPETPLLLCSKVLNKTYSTVKATSRDENILIANQILSQIRSKTAAMSIDEVSKIQIESILTDIEKNFQSEKNKSFHISISSISHSLFDSFIRNKDIKESNIRSLLNEIYKIKNDLAQLEINLSFEINETRVRDLWSQMQELTRNIITFDANVAASQASQAVLEAKLDSVKKRYLKLLDSRYYKDQAENELSRLAQYSNMSIEVLHEFQKRLQISRVEQLQKNIKECFCRIAQKDDLIQDVSIDPITLDIHLVDFAGTELTKDQLSAGEKQIFAVSLLWGLARCSGYEMPVIIDTPLGRLDSIHRTSFVKEYLPNAANQVVILSTDEELNNKYLDLVQESINDKYIIQYDENEKSSTITKGYF